MATRRRRRGAIGLGRTALSLPDRLRRALLPVAFVAGCAGAAALLVCGALWVVPEENRPELLAGHGLVVATVLSLCVASLLGWGCVQDGQARVRQGIGRIPAAIVFVVLPLAAAALSFAGAHEVGGDEVTGWAETPAVHLFARWYVPALIALSLAVFLAVRTRPRRRVYLTRGAGFLLLVTPYVVLSAVLLLDLGTPWLEEPIEDAVHGLARSSIALQLVIGFFLGDRSGD